MARCRHCGVAIKAYENKNWRGIMWGGLIEPHYFVCDIEAKILVWHEPYPKEENIVKILSKLDEM